MPAPQQRAENGAEQQSRTAEDKDDFDQTDGIVEDADVRHRRLPLLPSAPMARRAAAGARGGAEFGAGLARVGGLEDLAAGVTGVWAVVVRGFAGRRAAGAIGQGFRAVHFVEMGFVDFGGAACGSPLTPTLSP